MTRIPVSPALRRLVAGRVGYRCEYCLLAEQDTTARHTIDHIIAVKHGGPTEADNLALACVECNANKGSDIATIDLESGELVPLFNPRLDIWEEHFAFDGAAIVGLTPIGRGTVRMLQFNEPIQLQRRVRSTRSTGRSD